jgi:hypothetical protein
MLFFHVKFLQTGLKKMTDDDSMWCTEEAYRSYSSLHIISEVHYLEKECHYDEYLSQAIKCLEWQLLSKSNSN